MSSGEWLHLLKYLIRPSRIPSSAFILEDMLEIVKAHATYRFIILDEEEERPRLLVRTLLCIIIISVSHFLLDLVVQTIHASLICNNRTVHPSEDGFGKCIESFVQNSSKHSRCKLVSASARACLFQPLRSRQSLREIPWIPTSRTSSLPS